MSLTIIKQILKKVDKDHDQGCSGNDPAPTSIHDCYAMLNEYTRLVYTVWYHPTESL